MGSGPKLDFVRLVLCPKVGAVAVVLVQDGSRRLLKGLSNPLNGDGLSLNVVVHGGELSDGIGSRTSCSLRKSIE